MERFENAQVGDEVYCRLYGAGTIHRIEPSANYPVLVRFKDGTALYLLSGKYYLHSPEPTLFYRNETSNYLEERPVKVPDYSTWNVDDRVYVTNIEEVFNKRVCERAFKRHFAGAEENYVLAFDQGRTSWSNGDSCDKWESTHENSDTGYTEWIYAWKEGE